MGQILKKAVFWLGTVLVGVGITTGLILELSPSFSKPPVNSRSHPVDMSLSNIEASRAETTRLQNSVRDTEQLLWVQQEELMVLRSQLDRIDQRQQAMIRNLAESASSVTPTESENSEGPVWDDKAEIPILTPEEELAQARRQLEILDSAMLAETIDSQWANGAQLAVAEVFQDGEIPGVQLTNIECRTTLCRLELFLDGSMSPEASFRNLVHIAPWPGQSLVNTVEEGGVAEVYLAREGYSLPQSIE